MKCVDPYDHMKHVSRHKEFISLEIWSLNSGSEERTQIQVV